METISIDQPAAEIESDGLVVVLFADEPLDGAAAEIDEATGGAIKRLLDSKDIGTGACRVTPLLGVSGIAAGHLVVLGLGHREDFHPGVAFHAAAAAARSLSGRERASVMYCVDPNWSADLIENTVAGAIVGCHGQDLYRSEKKRFPFEKILFNLPQDLIDRGSIIGESINLTRRLVNEPAENMYPVAFADAARSTFEQLPVEVEVWDRERLQKEKCGALLAVARGSSREPQLVIARYRGGKDNDDSLALVGKGVTFDSGGLSLKPSDSMKTMKCDMAGAATVLGAMRAIAALKLPVNVTGYMGLVENMMGPSAYKLGDVLTARNGTTIEIFNTDAEGRLVLADALTVAVDQGADRIIDLATLTGACVVALGENVAGVMTNDQQWCDYVLDAADTVGEGAWQLPMFEEFNDQILSKVADIKNTGEGRWGGAITAAKLLEHFVEDLPWTHIDIAGPAYAEKPLAWLDGGATGCMVRTLVEVARSDFTPVEEE